MKKKLGMFVSVIATVVALIIPSAANATPEDQLPIITATVGLQDSGFVTKDAAGQPLKTLTVSGDEAERTLTAQTLEGETVVIREFSAVPVELPKPKTTEELNSDRRLAVEKGPVWTSPADHKLWEGGITADEAKFDPADLKPNFAYAVASTSVSFVWASPGTDFEVERDRVLVAHGFGSSFEEAGLAPGQEYEYVITSTVAGTESSEGAQKISRTFRIKTLGTAQKFSAHVAPFSYQYWTTAYMHVTFIDAAMTPPLESYETFACSGWPWEQVTFSGDDRSWDFPDYTAPFQTLNYRTMMFVNVNWDNPAPYTLYLTKNVGATHIYVNGVLTDTRYATMDNMSFDSPSASSSYAQLVLNHSAGNPFCSLGAITYHDEVRFYRTSGLVEVTGWRYPVPHHEAYVRLSTSGGTEYWNTMFRRTNSGFDCLLGYCTKDSYYANVS